LSAGASLAAALSLALLTGCAERVAAERVSVVHLAWPGRPASDAMDRDTFGDARVIARTSRLAFTRVTQDATGPGYRELLEGVGTLVFLGEVAIARRVGVASPRAWLAFLDAALLAARAHAELGTRGDPAAVRVLASHDVALGFPERAATLLRARAEFACGEVALARATLDAIDAAQVPPALAARLLLAERRAREAVERIAPIAAADAEARLALAEALLDLDRRAEAQALLRELADGVGEPGARAEELLAGSLRGDAGHAHGR
jgi:hypothetical protein